MNYNVFTSEAFVTINPVNLLSSIYTYIYMY